MNSIRRRLLLWVLGAMSGGALLLAAALYALTLAEMNELFDEHLQQVALAVALSLPDNDEQDADADAAATADRPAAHPAPQPDDEPGDFDFHTAVYTLQGRLLFSSHADAGLPFSAREGLAQVRSQDALWSVYTVAGAGRIVQVAQPASARQELALDAALQGVALLLALMAVIALLLVWAVRRALAPLDQAAASLASRSAASLQPIAPAGMPTELRPLVSAINALMQRLAVAFTRQRRFVADAAHELRTPVTVLRLQLQLLERAADPAARAAAVAELRGGIQRSQRLIEQLLALSRTEPEVDDTRLERIDLADVVRDSVRHRAAQAERRDIDLAATGSGECVVAGDREQLAVLLGNLLDNALQHTPAGSAVRVSAAPVDGRPALAVVDDGPGIAEAERSRVFDRFYRIRTAGDNGSADREMGSGLGLAIVQAIAQRHGAVVSLHTAAAGRGLEVRVAFPAPPAAA